MSTPFIPLRARAFASLTSPLKLGLSRPSPAHHAAFPLLSTLTHQTRHSSHSPMAPTTSPTRKPITLAKLRKMHSAGEPITMLTAHDFPSALVADTAGMDMLLVGDSLAMVAMGMSDTSEVTLDEMLLFMRCVGRAVSNGHGAAFTVGDLPMGSYEVSPEQALRTAIRVVKEGRMSSVKLEGGASMAPTVAKITSAGIPVLGHIGLLPQRSASSSGFTVQGKTAASATRLLHDALALQKAGVYGIVLEAVPPQIAELITERLEVFTIGIGAGAGCSGQVLVQCDMAGNFPTGRKVPKFVKQYGNVWDESMKAITQYRDEVKSGAYPAEEHCYQIDEKELEMFKNVLDNTSTSRFEK